MNLDLIRKDFPILETQVNGHQIVYFDNGATTQRPLPVVNAVVDYVTRMAIRTEARIFSLSLHQKLTTLPKRSSVTSSMQEAKKKSFIPETRQNP